VAYTPNSVTYLPKIMFCIFLLRVITGISAMSNVKKDSEETYLQLLSFSVLVKQFFLYPGHYILCIGERRFALDLFREISLSMCYCSIREVRRGISSKFETHTCRKKGCGRREIVTARPRQHSTYVFEVALISDQKRVINNRGVEVIDNR